MSRNFTQNLSNLMQMPSGTATLLNGANAVTGSIWGYPRGIANISVANFMLGIPSSTTGAEGFGMSLYGGSTGGRPRLRVRGRMASGDDNVMQHSAVLSLNAWHHFCGVFDPSGDELVAGLDGALETLPKTYTGTTVVTPGSSDESRIGCSMNEPPASSDLQFDGLLAHVAVWTVRLDDRELIALSTGVSPLLVRPQSLVLYWPLWGRHSPEIELINGKHATITGTIDPGEHEPPMEDTFGSTMVDTHDEILAGGGGNIAALSARLLQTRKVA